MKKFQGSWQCNVILLRMDWSAGTQLDDLLQEESEQYQEQYAAAVPSMRAALVDINKGAQANGHGMSEAEGGAPGDELCPGLSHGEAIRALAWADAVVDRCGVPGPSGSQLAILPLICALPKVGSRDTQRTKLL